MNKDIIINFLLAVGLSEPESYEAYEFLIKNTRSSRLEFLKTLSPKSSFIKVCESINTNEIIFVMSEENYEKIENFYKFVKESDENLLKDLIEYFDLVVNGEKFHERFEFTNRTSCKILSVGKFFNVISLQ